MQPVPSSSSTNVSLIDRVRVDDSRAWRELVDLYGPLVAHWCRKMGVCESQVADAVQDVFLAVLRSLSGFQPEGYQGFRAWLWGVTRHRCIDLLRRGNRHPPGRGGTTAMVAAEQVADPNVRSEKLDDPTDALQLNHLVRRAITQVQSEFEEKTWQAFYRTTVEGIATAAVAQELGVTSATVRQYRSRVLRRLRKQLGDSP